MKWYRILSLSLVFAVLVPAAASAQKDNKFTKEASKFIGLAMTKQDPAARAPLYEQALAQLEQSILTEPQNAKGWLLAGQAHAALNHFVEADSAFRVAERLHPAYAEEISSEREQAWVAAFNIGAELMNQSKVPEATAALEQAQMMYAHRPEALMNLGALYANVGDYDKSIKAFEGARIAIKGPLAEKLDSAQKASWTRFDEMARINIAQIHGQRGVDAFTAKDYEGAAKSFQEALNVNPVSRDYLFNLTQSIWAQASTIEEKLDSMPKPQQAEAKQKLIAIYREIDKQAEKVVAVDPASEMIYVIRARAHRMMGEYTGDPAKAKAGSEQAMHLLEQRQALPYELSEIIIRTDATDDGAVATVSGKLKNLTLAPGATATVKFTLLGIDGNVLADQAIPVTAPAKDQQADFEAKVPVTGEVAGWKYSIN